MARTAKWIGIFPLAAVAALVLTWIGWNAVATRRLAQAIELVHQRGEPIYSADFERPTIPDDQNAAFYLKSAYLAIVPGVDCPSASNLNYEDAPPFPPAWLALENAAIAVDGKAFALARQARQWNQAQWFSAPISDAIRVKTFIPYLNGMRHLANNLGDGAFYSHIHGDDAEAIERLRDVMHLSDMLNEGNSVFVCRLVSIGTLALALDRIEAVSADNLKIHSMPGDHGVPREVIEGLIVQLGDESQIGLQLRQAMMGERMLALDLGTDFASQMTVLRPMFKLDTVHVLNLYDQIIAAGAAPSQFEARALLARVPMVPANFSTVLGRPSPWQTPRFSRAASTALVGSMDREIETEWRVRVERRVVTIALAARLFRTDTGRWPARLSELAPKYLPAVPVDPFMPGSPPIGYLLQSKQETGAQERPLVYFDAKGIRASGPPPLTRMIGWTNLPNRQWRDLSNWQEPASTQAVEH